MLLVFIMCYCLLLCYLSVFLVLMLAAMCSMCILHIFVICNRCYVTAILTVKKYKHISVTSLSAGAVGMGTSPYIHTYGVAY